MNDFRRSRRWNEFKAAANEITSAFLCGVSDPRAHKGREYMLYAVAAGLAGTGVAYLAGVPSVAKFWPVPLETYVSMELSLRVARINNPSAYEREKLKQIQVPTWQAAQAVRREMLRDKHPIAYGLGAAAPMVIGAATPLLVNALR